MSESHAANTTSFKTCKWGYHGLEFEEYDDDAAWREVGGLFLFVSRKILTKHTWERCVLYVEATPNFASSIPNHPMLPKARQLAGQLGLIWVHARVVEDSRLRHEMEDSLLDNLRPRLNFQ